jgi:membrane protease YdiL (CAAX protease family)
MSLPPSPDSGSPEVEQATPVHAAQGDVTRKILPSRYLVKESAQGPYLTCVEAPNLSVRIQRGRSVSAAAARRFPRGTIFLDGAARSRPFLDTRRRIYNLDHHEGCIRAFTLATCEQALVVILKGLDLRSSDWTIHANDADIDAVLAIWVLLNHSRISAEGSPVRRQIMPLVRLEGIIDSYGLELTELSGFPDEMQQHWLAVIERLCQDEQRLKREGKWSSIDLLAYAQQLLQTIDELVYSARDFEHFGVVDELARINLVDDHIAVVCRSTDGIYDVEKRLRKLHGERLGLIFLQTGPTTYTARQVDPFLPLSLDAVYERLNQLDPAVERNSSWGGSTEIGGSPRAGGSQLSPQEVGQACDWVFHLPSIRQRIATTIRLGALAGLVVTAAALLAFAGWPAGPFPGLLAPGGIDTIAIFFTTIAFISTLLLLLGTRSRGRVSFGARLPVRSSWPLLLPLALVAAITGMAGGSWAPLHLLARGWGQGLPGYLVPLLGAVAAELLFRGVVHGYLAGKFHVQRPGGTWFLSVPNALAAVMSSIATVVLLVFPAWSLPGAGKLAGAGHWIAAIALLSLTCGMARERTGSVAASVMIHVAAALLAWALVPALLMS